MSKIIPLSLILLSLIVTFLVIHHSITHENGTPFDFNDFKLAGNGLFSSHEGIILFAMVLVLGVIIGGKLK